MKIHATCDALGNPLRFILMGDEYSDYTKALELINRFDFGFLLADKGYDADYIVEFAGESKTVIPPRSMRKTPRSYDRCLYKERNLVEHIFNKIKHFRRVATRYDKLGIAYLSFLHIAESLILLK